MKTDKEIADGVKSLRQFMSNANAIKEDRATTTLISALDIIIGDIK